MLCVLDCPLELAGDIATSSSRSSSNMSYFDDMLSWRRCCLLCFGCSSPLSLSSDDTNDDWSLSDESLEMIWTVAGRSRLSPASCADTFRALLQIAADLRCSGVGAVNLRIRRLFVRLRTTAHLRNCDDLWGDASWLVDSLSCIVRLEPTAAGIAGNEASSTSMSSKSADCQDASSWQFACTGMLRWAAWCTSMYGWTASKMSIPLAFIASKWRVNDSSLSKVSCLNDWNSLKSSHDDLTKAMISLGATALKWHGADVASCWADEVFIVSERLCETTKQNNWNN